MHILLSSASGNGVRFPHAGFLALTPVTVQGVVRTKLDDDRKPLPAKSFTVSVRCYESRMGRRGVVHSNILAEYSTVVWQCPPSTESAPLGDFDSTFRVTIPRDTPGLSTVSFQDYRIFWRLEAVVDHLPIPGVGSRLVKSAELHNLIRYDLPPLSPPPSPPPAGYLPHQTSKPRAPVVRYYLDVPTEPIGPLDLLSVGLSLRPIDPSVSIRSASLTVERRMEIRDSPAAITSDPVVSSPLSPSVDPYDAHLRSPLSSTPPPSSPPPHINGSPSPLTLPSASNLTINTVDTAYTYDSRHPLLSPPPPSSSSPTAGPSKLASMTVAGTESAARHFARDPETGVWSRTMTVQWPAARSHTKWALGEQITTDMCRVRFYVKVKIVVSSPSGTDSLELREQPLTVVSTNAAERSLALSKYKDSLRSSPTPTRGKSKSPHRSSTAIKSPSPAPEVPLDAPFDMWHLGSSSNNKHGNAPRPGTSDVGGGSGGGGSPRDGKRKRTREGSGSARPHTSAGPRPHTSSGPREHASSSKSGGRTSNGIGGIGGAKLDRLGGSLSVGWRPGTAMAASASTALPAVARASVTITPPKTLKSSLSTGAYSPATSDETVNGGIPTLRVNTITGVTTRTQHKMAVAQEQVRAWEEELERIEMQSRRSSVGMARIARLAGRHRTG